MRKPRKNKDFKLSVDDDPYSDRFTKRAQKAGYDLVYRRLTDQLAEQDKRRKKGIDTGVEMIRIYWEATEIAEGVSREMRSILAKEIEHTVKMYLIKSKI